MNPNNYASLEASQRLVEAGVMLETDFWWIRERSAWRLADNDYGLPREYAIPAPSMAEVWREPPETALQPCRDTTTGYCHEYLSLQKDGDLTVAGYGEYSEIGRNSNPTDALIDLLIWVRKEASHEG